jgi:polysaccharide deacetylase 2 family uncharacterized protein YibQ
VRQLLITLLVFFSTSIWAKTSQIAIIIDDMGYRQSDVAALNLPGKITYAVLPQTPFGKILAEKAHATNREVMLHIPMEADNGKRLGPGALTSEMSEQNIRASLEKSFTEIPFAVGINNHMGSKLTKMYRPMAWTMRYLKENKYLFVDSLTTPTSKAQRIAKHFGVPSLHRHLFLDNELTPEYIGEQFEILIDFAKRYNSIVAIAHPHPETIAALTQLLPLLEKHNIELVPISRLLPQNKQFPQSLVKTD